MSRSVFFTALLSIALTACGGGGQDEPVTTVLVAPTIAAAAAVATVPVAAPEAKAAAEQVASVAPAPKAEFIGFTATGGAKLRLTFTADDFVGGVKAGDTVYLKHSFVSIYDANTPKSKVQEIDGRLVAEIELFYAQDSTAMIGVVSAGYAANFVNGLPSRPMVAPDQWQLPPAIAPFKQGGRWYLAINLNLL